MIERAQTKFARSGDARIAYQVLGDGSVDLIVVGGPASHLDMEWEEGSTVRCFERLARFARLIRFDRRGTGLSDPVADALTLEQQMDDLGAVMDAIGTKRVALVGSVEAGVCAMYAATYPERVTALVLFNVATAGSYVITEEQRGQLLDVIENHWGEGQFLGLFAPSRLGDSRFEEWWARYERASASPAMARKTLELFMRTDLRSVLPTVRVPTLVLHSSQNPLIPVELGREVASLIPGAQFREFPGVDMFWSDSNGPFFDEVEMFLTGRRRPQEADRVLATVLFTDIVGSTDRAAAMGDHAWRELLARHNELVRLELERWRGREVKSLGDGFVATFDGPARAIRCAQAIVEVAGRIGLDVRAGLHTGECELLEDDVTGIAVHIASRLCTMAQGGEVLASSTVNELTVGSGLGFVEKGVHALRGVPGEWRVFALTQ